MRRILAGVGAVLAVAGAAMAGPRDTVTVTNLNSDTPNGNGNGALTALGTYTARYVRIQGTLTKVTTGATYVREALVELFPPGATTPWVFSTSPTTNFSGSVNVDVFLRGPAPVAALGGWSISTFESYDDGAGADSRWDTLTITLNDGPPANKNLGALSVGTVSRVQHLAPNQLHWYKFELQGDVNALAGTYLDIDTEGSSIAAAGFSNDTVIALYDENGQVVGFDDDDGIANMAQLSYGVPMRPSAGADGLIYDGRDGPLAAGTYYLVVRAYLNGDEPTVGWSWPITGSTRTGPVKVNIRTNVGSPQSCKADYNESGGIEVQDIFDFLNSWLAGCP